MDCGRVFLTTSELNYFRFTPVLFQILFPYPVNSLGTGQSLYLWTFCTMGDQVLLGWGFFNILAFYKKGLNTSSFQCVSINICSLQAIHWKFDENDPQLLLLLFLALMWLLLQEAESWLNVLSSAFPANFHSETKLPRLLLFHYLWKSLWFTESSPNAKMELQSFYFYFNFQFSFHCLVVRTSCLLSELLILN